ncbi:TetR/AcrR family transcriptional regulator [[Clostridium] fimetarium]|uniref:DNA-binding transcriptional regulator, AcrR family n=1 Tax=[Clostridium] fimetarium TaxID=99656 RepID=A0A1I0M5B5_9FIRM|nr:TetR/AcrR family transcriptional regulator [[Clostridium] fimetarium]SEV83482.1 DNA-binding transcriptional regulator, AcrR family [[Clostridium] fimetarium]
MKNEERILEAALEVVEDYTISGTRMHLIAKKAEMFPSNIHYYYRTKDELLLALQQKVLNKCLKLRADIRAHSKDTLESQLNVFFEQKKAFIMEYREYDYAEIDFWVQSRVDSNIKKGFADSFSGWREEIRQVLEKYIPDVPEEGKVYLSAHIVSILEGATIQYLMDEKSFDLDKYFAFGKKMILIMINAYKQ